MGYNDDVEDWRWSCAIVATFFCSCCVIISISSVIWSTGTFEGELSSVDGVNNVDIKEKDVIVYGVISGSLGEIVLVIRIPGWRCSHASSEENNLK